MVPVFLALFQCHQENDQFDIVSVNIILLNIIFKITIKLFGVLFFNVRRTKTIAMYENFLKYIDLCGRSNKTF